MWTKKYLKFFSLTSIIGIVVGLIGGYIYYLQVGCSSGACAITSNPWYTMLWAGTMGYLVGDMFTPKPKKVESE